MIKELDLNLMNTLKEVYDLQRASYQIEAQLINFFEIPPLTEALEDLGACDETFLGYFEEETLAGAISYTVKEHELTICRMIVHPSHFRKGIAQKLLKKVEEQNQNISVLYVSTGKENLPAKNLYLKNGFQFVSDQEVVPGLYISHLIKEKHQPK
ncbi:acetyltransferase (GNAT) family protein [Neobacillus bataviensis]|uniref:Acetyltransferase (GNAT) family protein n=1 Tax=Neobacillus bataviensis TaxID=220685 RepID=A0A561DYJ1_9BACI|nr:GNAT family N-acetyltransferase [Neobacillus bataviensis]TWE08400.1 acetyltransferase (GNAT) family protein [Neobacillus bataviensis]